MAGKSSSGRSGEGGRAEGNARPRVVIAGISSGVGKTTVTVALMAALRDMGLRVQGFKSGPDYIDPSYHAAATGRPSRNLDGWMMGRDALLEVFLRGSDGADLSVIEGVMGLYDGRDPLSDEGSTAEVAKLLRAPVVLVVDVAKMARSAAAVVMGFQKLDPDVAIAGVIANFAASERHFQLVKSAVEDACRVPVLGYLPRRPDLSVPERHLGLVPAVERGELDGLFARLSQSAKDAVDLGRLRALAESAEALPAVRARLFQGVREAPRVTVAVAKDAAFNFYYPENLELLEWHGARIRYFSPLAGETPPDNAAGLYIGGGFPEEFAAPLSARTGVLQDLGRRIRAGMPTFAECGGYMFLSEAIVDRAGCRHPMVGMIPMVVTMQDRLAGFGYREVAAERDSVLFLAGETARGHEFHYSSAAPSRTFPAAYEARGLRGTNREGYSDGSLLAGYTHLHFASNPGLARRFVAACEAYRNSRAGGAGSEE